MTEYDINLDAKFAQLQHIDVGAEAAAVEPWFNQTLTVVNDSVVRLGVVEGEFHWHKHVNDIENDATIVLLPNQGVTIPKGVVHRPRATKRTVMIMVEPGTIAPTGD